MVTPPQPTENLKKNGVPLPPPGRLRVEQPLVRYLPLGEHTGKEW